MELSAAGRLVVDTWLREVDHLDVELAAQTRALERLARGDVRAQFLQSVPIRTLLIPFGGILPLYHSTAHSVGRSKDRLCCIDERV